MPRPAFRVLISGASVAGPTAAYWLSRAGYAVTVVERMPLARVRSSGHAVDLFGPAMDVAEWTGVLPAITDARTRTEIVSFQRSPRPRRRRGNAAHGRRELGPTRRDHARGTGHHPVRGDPKRRALPVRGLDHHHRSGTRRRSSDVRTRPRRPVRHGDRRRRPALHGSPTGLRAREPVPPVPRRLPRGRPAAQLLGSGWPDGGLERPGAARGDLPRSRNSDRQGRFPVPPQRGTPA